MALAQYIDSRSLLKSAEVLYKYSNQNKFFLMDMKDGSFSMMDRISYIINLYVMINYVWWGYVLRDTSRIKVEGVLLGSSLGSGQSPGSFLCCSWLHSNKLLWQTYTLLSQQLQDKLNLEGLVQVFRASVLFLLKVHFHDFLVNLRNLKWCIDSLKLP